MGESHKVFSWWGAAGWRGFTFRIKQFLSEKGLCPRNHPPPSQIRPHLPPSTLVLEFVLILLLPKGSENSKSLSKINSGPQAIGLGSSKHLSPDHKVEVTNIPWKISDEWADNTIKKQSQHISNIKPRSPPSSSVHRESRNVFVF